MSPLRVIPYTKKNKKFAIINNLLRAIMNYNNHAYKCQKINSNKYIPSNLQKLP